MWLLTVVLTEQKVNDMVTPHEIMKQEYCDFIGTKAFEEDAGWSHEVWTAAWAACLKQMKSMEQCSYCGAIVFMKNPLELLPDVPQ